MHSDILNFTETPAVDEGIESYEWHKYQSSESNRLNDDSGDITINIENQDQFLHPSESYLLVEGRLTKADGSAYADADVVTLINNGIMYLFSSIDYKIANDTIERAYHPGQATTMLGILKYPHDFQVAHGLNQLWYKETGTAASLDNHGFKSKHEYIIKRPADKGKFSFVIPLKHIFGFCDDYDKIIYGVKHSLIFTRKSANDAIFRAHAAAAGKITIETLAWYMPHVTPSDLEKLQLMKAIESKCNVPIAFRARRCDTGAVTKTRKFSYRLGSINAPEKPRYIIVGFQTEKDGDQEKNPSIFDHCKVKKIYVKLNTDPYPAEEYNIDFPNQRFSREYRATAMFNERYYGMNELVSQGSISPADFRDLYPLFVFDVSKQSEKLKSSTSDVYVETEFHENVPEGTYIYVVTIYDKMFNLQSNGNRLVAVSK